MGNKIKDVGIKKPYVVRFWWYYWYKIFLSEKY